MYSNRKFYRRAMMVVMAGLLFVGCRNEADIGDLPNIYFETDIKPIMTGNCTMCHDDMDNYNEVMEMVSPGKPHSSELYNVITNPWAELRMPEAPRAPLTETQRSIINLWILQGAPQKP